jgi:hypothetical protein
LMNTINIGLMPNDAAFHAEANLLLRAAEAHGGTLSGRWIHITVDRALCPSCRAVLPEIGRMLGNPLISVRDGRGNFFTMRDGLLSQR